MSRCYVIQCLSAVICINVPAWSRADGEESGLDRSPYSKRSSSRMNSRYAITRARRCHRQANLTSLVRHADRSVPRDGRGATGALQLPCRNSFDATMLQLDRGNLGRRAFLARTMMWLSLCTRQFFKEIFQRFHMLIGTRNIEDFS